MAKISWKELEARKIKSQEDFNKRMNGALAVIQAGHNALMNMMKKSVEDNVAGITEGIVDGIIIGEIVGVVGTVGGIVGNKCIDASRGISMMPTNLLGATPTIIGGEAVAIIGGATIGLSEAIGAQAKALLDPLSDAGILAAQANNAYNKAKGSKGGGNGGKQGGGNSKPTPAEPVKGSPEWKEKFPNGEYKGADYHKKGQDTNWGGKTKSPEPQNGQKCLDNSYGVKDYPHRVAIEDGKVVVIRKTADGNYHGYVCDAWKDVPSELQAALRKEKLVHPKSGDVL